MAKPSPYEVLKGFYPGPMPGRLPIYTTTWRGGNDRSYWCYNLREADRACSRYRTTRQLLFSVALHHAGCALKIALTRRKGAALGTVRGCEDSVAALPALWVVIPYRPAGRQVRGAAAPPAPDLGQAIDLLQAVGLRPSIVISGGGRLLAFWLLDRLWKFETEKELALKKEQTAARALLWRLRYAVESLAAERGLRIGPGAATDLAAAFPVPGTVIGPRARGPEAVLKAFPLGAADGRYRRRDFESLPEAPPEEPLPWGGVLEPRAAFRKARRIYTLAPIAGGCQWLGHCHTDRTTLGREELAYATRLLAMCEAPGADSARLIHEVHSGHPGYDQYDVEKKIAAVLRGLADPITCVEIGKAPGVFERYCSACPHRGRIEAPVELAPEHPFELVLAGATPAPPETPAPAFAEPPDPAPTAAAESAELLAGLEEALSSLGGAATARRIVAALTAEPERFPRLAAAFARLAPALGPGDPSAVTALGLRLRALKGRVFGGRAAVEARRAREGVVWAVRRATADPDPQPTMEEAA